MGAEGRQVLSTELREEEADDNQQENKRDPGVLSLGKDTLKGLGESGELGRTEKGT